MSASDSENVTITANPKTGEVSAEPAETGAALDQPGKYATPLFWGIIIFTFAAVMLLGALSLMIEFLSPGPRSEKVEASMVLVLFSTCAAFLTGLVIPSPINRK